MQGGRNTTSVITPAVKAAAREQLGCATLVGAELEDDGGQGTLGSHWEQRLYEGTLICAALSSTCKLCVSATFVSMAFDTGCCVRLKAQLILAFMTCTCSYLEHACTTWAHPEHTWDKCAHLQT